MKACHGQLRVGPGGAYAIDFPAVLTFAALAGPLTREFADLMTIALPRAETAIVASLRKDDDA